MSKEVVFLFPGQGAQYVSMGQDFYEQYEESRKVFDQADQILGYSLSKIIFEGPKKDLTLTKYSQLAIFVASVAIAKAFEAKFPDITPTICAGLSLGEYTALFMSKKLSFEECLLLVQARANAMQDASIKYPGSLSVILGLTEGQVREHLKEHDYKLWIANLNCPGQVVISGSLSELEKATQSLKDSGARRVLPLDVSGAFHSGLMSDAQEALKKKITPLEFQDSSIEIIMNVTGELTEEASLMKENLIQQVSSTTHWEKSILNIAKKPVQFYLELGPGKSLSGMNKKIGVSAPTYNVEKVEDLEKLLEKIGVCYA